MRWKKEKIYALYIGERNVCDGTIEEIAKQVNKPVELINWYKYPSYKKRRRSKTTENYNYIELVEIEDEFKYVRIEK